jgi:hypothetical protein
MTELHQVIHKVVPVVRVVLDWYGQNKQLYTLQESVHDLQLSINWLLLAVKELPEHDNELVQGGQPMSRPPMITTPTMISAQDHYNYAKAELADAHKLLEQYVNSNTLPQTTNHKIMVAGDRLMESIFNINLAIQYYEQPTSFRVV